MKIAGFIKNSLIDYPGKISSVIFTQGCNMKCKFCHNRELVPMQHPQGDVIEEHQVLGYLQKAKDFIDALVVTGGEPTLQPNLSDFIRKVKEIGLSVKLDTNGTNPKLVRDLLNQNLLDYVAMDVKTILDLDAYKSIAGNQFSANHLLCVYESVDILNDAKIDVEFRTTLIRECHSKEDIRKICEVVKGNCKYTLQQFSPAKVLDDSFAHYSPYSKMELKVIIQNNKDLLRNIRTI